MERATRPTMLDMTAMAHVSNEGAQEDLAASGVQDQAAASRRFGRLAIRGPQR